MISLMRCAKLASLAAVLGCGNTFAGDAQINTDGSMVWQAGVDGVVIEWGPDGNFQRVYASYTQPVSVPNAHGIRTAKKVAEERAKAQIVRFMEQDLTDTRVTETVTEDVQKSIAAAGAIVSEQASNQVINSFTEVTRSSAMGQLRGVIVLEEGYDESTKEAWVKVGLSSRTMRAAQSVRDAIQETAPQARDHGTPQSPTGERSHVRRTQQEDW